MLPATAVPAHSINTLDRIAFYKSVREKRKQLQLNHQSNGNSVAHLSSSPSPLLSPSPGGKDNSSSSTENAFLTQMLQSTSSSMSSPANSSLLNMPSLLRKGELPVPSPHRTVTSTLTNILPALLNGTLQSPRAGSPLDVAAASTMNMSSPTSTNTTDTLVDIKCSTSLPVSPAADKQKHPPSDSSRDEVQAPTSCSPPRCRSYPMAAFNKRTSPLASTAVQPMAMPTSYLLATALSCPSLTTTNATHHSATSPSPDETVPKIVRSASVKSCASDSGVSSSSPLSDNNIVHVTTSPLGL